MPRPRAGALLAEARLTCQVLVEQGGANPPSWYMDTSPIRNSVLLDPTVGLSRVLWWSLGWELFLMSEVPLGSQ